MVDRATSPTGLSSGRQRARWRFTLTWDRKELGDIDGQCCRDTIEEINRRVEVTSLDSTDGRAVDPCVYGKIFLRHLLVGTHLSKIPSKSLTSIHDRMATILKAANPSDISNISQFTREVRAAGDKQ
ncbi:hypothetical protein Rleg10DRAFT_2848 [Rhizobium leguminosarum bv. trifolii WSM2012]|nr:hypothetical protein Rleg10DRAFT_2848 [Rhizobium leguminosarum bv. trifolii WSM2012]